MADFERNEFSGDPEDPHGSWVAYVEAKQGEVGLNFPGRGFQARASSRNVGRLQIVNFATAPIEYCRSEKRIRHGEGENSHRLVVPLAGRIRFEQGDSREVFHPGRVGFFQWGVPFLMSHKEPVDALILTVPEGTVDADRAAKASLLLDETRPLVRGLARQVRSLVEDDGWTGADFSVACNSIFVQLDGALNPYPSITSGQLAKEAERARVLIEEHAHDHRTTPAAIAAMVGVAERTLYRAFEQAGYPAPGLMLRTIRLERAQRRLCSTVPVDMAQLARQTGFTSLRRFREAYRSRYGRTPMEFRAELLGDGG